MIVGVNVVSAGSDMVQLAPMVEQVEQRCGQVPGQWLVDGGYPAHEQIDAVDDKTVVYAPVPEPRAKKDEQGNKIEELRQGKHVPKPSDSEAVARWRAIAGSYGCRCAACPRCAASHCSMHWPTM